MATSTAEVGILNEPILRESNFRSTAMRAMRRNPVGAFFGLVIVFLIIVATFGPGLTVPVIGHIPSISPADPTRLDYGRLKSPSLAHPFGTDNLARDMLARIIYGARNSLGVAFTSLAVSLALGVFLGITSGYLGGWVDMITQRIVDIGQAYPGLVFAIFFVTIFGREFWAVAIAIGITLMPGTIRIVRSATIAVRHQQFIEAALSIGNSPFRIMYRHVLPNVDGADHYHRQRPDRRGDPDRGDAELPGTGCLQRYQPKLGPHAAGDAPFVAGRLVDDDHPGRGDQRGCGRVQRFRRRPA